MGKVDGGIRALLRLPCGLLGMILLVLAIEATLSRREADFTADPWAWDWRTGGRSAGRMARGREILCFGDSLVKFSVMPRVIERRTGRKTYNLALGGGMAASSYFQLRHALRAGARPRAVVVDFWPDLLRRNPIDNPRQLAQVATLRDCLDLGWTSGDGRLFGRVVAEHLLTSLRCRPEIWAGVLAWVRGESSPGRDNLLAFQRNWRANEGSMVWPRHPEFVHGIRGDVGKMPGAVSRDWRNAVYPDAWREASPANRAYMERFFELAQARGIPVFYLLTPLHPVVQGKREQIGIDAAHTRFARSVQERFPGVTVVDARHAGYAPWVFMDFIHLDCLGSFEFSDDLAGVLERALSDLAGRPKWVDMPAYRGRPPHVELEDLDRSRVVLKRERERTLR